MGIRRSSVKNKKTGARTARNAMQRQQALRQSARARTKEDGRVPTR